jgi:hypothetical protein
LPWVEEGEGGKKKRKGLLCDLRDLTSGRAQGIKHTTKGEKKVDSKDAEKWVFYFKLHAESFFFF